MKKISDLQIKRNEKLNEMKAIVEQVISENRSKDESETSRYETLERETKALDARIKEFETLEALERASGEVSEVRTASTPKPLTVEFRDWLKDAVRNNRTDSFNGLAELRADPFITSTDSGVIQKTVAAGVDILTSPAEAFLKELGVTFYTNLVGGNFSVPSMGEDTAVFYGEDASAASADMATASLLLTARRVSHTQSISRETIAQTNPGVYASILQNLVNGVWNAVTNDVFDTLETDAATQAATVNEATVSYGTVLKMEASIGGLNINSGAYVTTPTIKAFLKGTAGLTNQAPMWNGKEMNGYPAYGVPAANSRKLYFGDWSRQVVGQFGGLEIVVDPYKDAKKGLINLTIIGLFDTGCVNKRAFAIRDVSVS